MHQNMALRIWRAVLLVGTLQFVGAARTVTSGASNIKTDEASEAANSVASEESTVIQQSAAERGGDGAAATTKDAGIILPGYWMKCEEAQVLCRTTRSGVSSVLGDKEECLDTPLALNPGAVLQKGQKACAARCPAYETPHVGFIEGALNRAINLEAINRGPNRYVNKGLPQSSICVITISSPSTITWGALYRGKPRRSSDGTYIYSRTHSSCVHSADDCKLEAEKFDFLKKGFGDRYVTRVEFNTGSDEEEPFDEKDWSPSDWTKVHLPRDGESQSAQNPSDDIWVKKGDGQRGYIARWVWGKGGMNRNDEQARKATGMSDRLLQWYNEDEKWDSPDFEAALGKQEPPLN